MRACACACVCMSSPPQPNVDCGWIVDHKPPLAQIGSHFVADASATELLCASAWLSVSSNAQGHVCHMQKGRSGRVGSFGVPASVRVGGSVAHTFVCDCVRALCPDALIVWKRFWRDVAAFVLVLGRARGAGGDGGVAMKACFHALQQAHQLATILRGEVCCVRRCAYSWLREPVPANAVRRQGPKLARGGVSASVVQAWHNG